MAVPFRTTVIGSYFRRDSQALRRPPLGREEAQAAVRWTVDQQVEAGMDIITDGEQRRESFITFVQMRMTGFDFRDLVPKRITPEHTVPVPRVTGRVAECHAGLAEDYAFARAHAPRHVEVKTTCAGPHILAAFTQNEHYPSETAPQVADRMRPALRRFPPERLLLTSECGFIYTSPHLTFGKMRALAGGAQILRQELTG